MLFNPISPTLIYTESYSFCPPLLLLPVWWHSTLPRPALWDPQPGLLSCDQSWRFLPGCRKTDFPRGIKGWAKPSWPLSGPHRDRRFWMGSRGTEFGQGTDTVLSEVHWTLSWSAELRKPRLTRHQMVIFNRRYQDP